MSLIGLEGHVNRCIFKDGSVFVLLDSNGNEYKCVRRGFQAVVGMKIAGRARLETNQKYGQQYTFTEEPKRLIDLDVSEHVVITALKKSSKSKDDTSTSSTRGLGQVGAKKLYDAILSQGNPLVVLQKACVFPEVKQWLKDVVQVLNIKLTFDQVDTLLKNWSDNETRNFLIALGIAPRKIKRMSDILVRKVLVYPFTFYELSVEQCQTVCDTFMITYDEEDLKVAHLARNILTDYLGSYSTYFCTPAFSEISNEYLKKHDIIKPAGDTGVGDTANLGPSCVSDPSCVSIPSCVSVPFGTYTVQRIYNEEKDLASWFKSHKGPNPDFDSDEFWDLWAPKCSTLAPEQIQAIKGSLRHSCSIITGPAGSGKTRIISEIVTILRQCSKTYVIGAFTGKATFRVRETLRSLLPAGEDILTYTLHSLIYKKKALEAKNSENDNDEDDLEEDFRVSGDNSKTIGSIPNYVVEQDPEVVILDESSMITGQLLHRFLKTFPKIKALICVGDAAQLEPFSSWGRPFHHLVQLEGESGIPVYELKQNFRSVGTEGPEGNGILINANRIRDEFYRTFRLKSPDHLTPPQAVSFTWTDNFIRYTGKDGVSVIMQLLKKLNNDGERASNIKILSPLNEKVNELNTLCQEFYFKQTIYGSKSIIISSRKFCIGDLVIVTKNNYKIGLFNGSEGRIIDIDEARQEIQVAFDEQVHWFGKVDRQKVVHRLKPDERGLNTVTKIERMMKTVATSGRGVVTKKEDYDEVRTINEIDDIQLAYALTIHRSQGSEWKFVILYIPYITRGCNRNMVYTGITRAKDKCFCIDENSECVKATGKCSEERREFFGTWFLQD